VIENVRIQYIGNYIRTLYAMAYYGQDITWSFENRRQSPTHNIIVLIVYRSHQNDTDS